MLMIEEPIRFRVFGFDFENDANRIGDEIYFAYTQFGHLLSQLSALNLRLTYINIFDLVTSNWLLAGILATQFFNQSPFIYWLQWWWMKSQNTVTKLLNKIMRCRPNLNSFFIITSLGTADGCWKQKFRDQFLKNWLQKEAKTVECRQCKP